MNITVKQISSLEKVMEDGGKDFRSVPYRIALAGERVCYQILLEADEASYVEASVKSNLAEHVRIYQVRDVMMDTPAVENIDAEDYLTLKPGMMPDELVPIEQTQGRLYLGKHACTLWVNVDLPKDIPAGEYEVVVNLKYYRPGGYQIGSMDPIMYITVLPGVVPRQKLIYTRWMYLDCIATAHNVEIFSEKHWEMIEKYIQMAADIGINMLMVPVHTPPLDTEIGTARPCVQLVDIEKVGQIYHFGFERFHRYIGLCKKHGIEYFEIAHMFTQWGAKCSPNIMVKENGELRYHFGWHVASDDPEYISFLKQYIPAIVAELEREGVVGNTYFHISDEPNIRTLDAYTAASEIIRPLIGICKSFDALSSYSFYEQGLVECPVTEIDHIHEFLEHDVPNQWLYYCCFPAQTYPNSFMAMPLYRVRILGFLMYKYGIQGFLHWGFNFYNGIFLVYKVNCILLF